MPTISVVITTHNRPQSLPRAIASAQAAGADVEVVVVDDASNDETASVCRGLSGIRYVRVERNQQVAGARNIGIINSTGEYIAFLDDDDMRLAGSLDLQVAALDSSPDAGLIYGQALISDDRIDVNESQRLELKDFYPTHCPHGDIFWELLEQNFIPCGAAVFRRSCLFRIGLLDQSIPGIDDWDLWIRIAALYPVIALEQPVVVWRRSTPLSGQGTSAVDEIAAMGTRHMKRKWLKLPPAANVSASMRRDVWRRFSNQLVSQMAVETISALRHAHYEAARKNLLTTIRLHPRASVRLLVSSRALRHLRDWAKRGPDAAARY
jgi:glycosyltransferase involved in cell wall biosynthesis